MDSKVNTKNGAKTSHRVIIQLKPTSSKTFQCEPVFALIRETLKKEGATYVKRVKAVFGFKVTDGPGGKTETWVVDVKNGTGSVQKGSEKVKTDCTVTIKDKDLLEMARGKLQPQAAFFSGKLKVKGNMSTALKLQQILPKTPVANL